MKALKEHYFIVIPPVGKATPVRCALGNTLRKIRAYTRSAGTDGTDAMPYCLAGSERFCMICRTANIDAVGEGEHNVPATYMLPKMLKRVYGGAALLRFCDNGDYAYFTKPVAKAICDIINNIWNK